MDVTIIISTTTIFSFYSFLMVVFNIAINSPFPQKNLLGVSLIANFPIYNSYDNLSTLPGCDISVQGVQGRQLFNTKQK